MARASGDPNNMHTLSWGGGGTTRKDPFIVSLLLWNNLNADSVTQFIMLIFLIKFVKISAFFLQDNALKIRYGLDP